MSDRRGCGLCWFLLLAVVILAGFAGFRLFSGGPTEVAGDGRAEIRVSAQNRDLVLAEMRGFLAAVQAITTALTQDDLQTVAAQARSVGLTTMAQMPASLMQALPLEFKTLGRSTHAEFDQLALDAEQLGDRDHALRQLGDLLNKCVACHATYRLSAAREGG